MLVLDALFDHIQQISSNVEIIGILVQFAQFRQLMSELGQDRQTHCEQNESAFGWIATKKRAAGDVVGEWQPATTSSQPTTSHSSNLHRSGYGYALMSPRPNSPSANPDRCRSSRR
jgi:hypothetical protein